MMKFFIEISYWSAYYMKWKSEKELSFSMGIMSIICISFCNVYTILSIIQLYTAVPAIDISFSLIPQGILTKENKLLLIFAIFPFVFLLAKGIECFIYKRLSKKKELYTYFEKMSHKRQTQGKLMFIAYSVLSVVIALFFISKVIDQREGKNEQPILQQRLEILREDIVRRDSSDSIISP